MLCLLTPIVIVLLPIVAYKSALRHNELLARGMCSVDVLDRSERQLEAFIGATRVKQAFMSSKDSCHCERTC